MRQDDSEMQTTTVLHFCVLFLCLNTIDVLQTHARKKQFYFTKSGFTYASEHTAHLLHMGI